MQHHFDHERLEAYRKGLAFVAWSESILDKIPKSAAAYGQMDRARTSILLNIAEGNGRFTAADRCRFFDIARGSCLECAACLDILGIKGLLGGPDLEHGKSILRDVVCLLVGLIRSQSSDRLHEEAPLYGIAP